MKREIWYEKISEKKEGTFGGRCRVREQDFFDSWFTVYLYAPEPVFVNVEGAQELIPPAYVAYSGPVRQLGGLSYQAGNRFLGSLTGLQRRALVKLLLSCELLFPMFSK